MSTFPPSYFLVLMVKQPQSPPKNMMQKDMYDSEQNQRINPQRDENYPVLDRGGRGCGRTRFSCFYHAIVAMH